MVEHLLVTVIHHADVGRRLPDAAADGQKEQTAKEERHASAERAARAAGNVLGKMQKQEIEGQEPHDEEVAQSANHKTDGNAGRGLGASRDN